MHDPLIAKLSAQIERLIAEHQAELLASLSD